MQSLDEVLESVLYASDLAAAERFYVDVLGLEVTGRKPGSFVFLKLARQMVLIFDPDASAASTGVPSHGALGPGHLCFAAAEDTLNDWAKRVQGAGVVIEQWQTWPRGGRSFYFRDPAGNCLEIASPRIWGFSETLSTTAKAR